MQERTGNDLYEAMGSGEGLFPEEGHGLLQDELGFTLPNRDDDHPDPSFFAADRSLDTPLEFDPDPNIAGDGSPLQLYHTTPSLKFSSTSPLHTDNTNEGVINPSSTVPCIIEPVGHLRVMPNAKAKKIFRVMHVHSSTCSHKMYTSNCCETKEEIKERVLEPYTNPTSNRMSALPKRRSAREEGNPNFAKATHNNHQASGGREHATFYYCGKRSHFEVTKCPRTVTKEAAKFAMAVSLPVVARPIFKTSRRDHSIPQLLISR